MNKLRYLSLYLLVFLIFNGYSFAQEIDPALLKNLSPAQIEMAKSQLSSGNLIEKPKPVAKESTIREVVSNSSKIKEGDKFGYSFFSSVPTTITAVGDLPLPNDYKISLQDQFTVILSGSRKEIFDLNVNLDGTVLFPELGAISVVGETFYEVKEKLRRLIEQSYIGVQLDLSIKNLSAKKITIVGAVNTPGTYLVNPFSTISSALAYSGGISEIGTLRKIRLIRNNGDIFYFDLYKLLIDGDRTEDITIEAGDVIIIDPAYQFVRLSGQVRRAAVYEMIQDETLFDILKYGLGFTKEANIKNIETSILDIESSSVTKTTTSDLGMSLSNVISINVNSYLNKNNSDINVRGAIAEPGYYDLEKYEYLEDLINDLQFVDVYPWLGVLEQFDSSNLVKSTTLFSLKDKSTYASVKLLPNSKVYFANIDFKSFPVGPSSQKIINEYKLTINHKGTSYELPIIGKFSLSSFIDLLGLDMSDIEKKATYISPLENIVMVDNYENMSFISKKFHNISFRSPINNLITVTVKGAVDYPGKYTLNSNYKLKDLYELIGDFKPEAFQKGIIFTRQSIRDRQIKSIEKSKEDLNEAILTNLQKGITIGDINIIQSLSQEIEPENLGRIAGDFSPGSESALNTILLDGDSIFIPKNPNAINILGEVLNPIAFEYKKGIGVREAINNSGGYKEYADKKRVYIIRSNGLIEKANRSIFAGNNNLEPGDTIIVPRKILTNNPGLDALLPVTQIISDLAFSAAAIQSLSNNNNK